MEAGSIGAGYSRKQKSLGLLCSKFISLYNKGDVDLVGLDDAAGRLGVERRRIYDIVNVLESVGVLARKGKNGYSWIGFSGIPKALKYLKEEALKEMAGEVAPNPSPLVEYSDDEEDDSLSHQTVEFGEDEGSPNYNAQSGISPWKVRSVMEKRREKSLGLLTQNFVKLFLTMDVDTVSLDEAAKLLLGAGDSSQMRNNAAKVRRLYDIANVLSSVNLIEKTRQAESRKPAFRWLGLNAEPQNDATVPSTKQSNKRVFGSDDTNTDFKRRKATTSVCNRSEIIKECNLTAQKQLQRSRRHVFGPFLPAGVAKESKDTEVMHEKKACDWETLATSFHPQHHNQVRPALSELFAHYLEAWKLWFVEVTQAGDACQSCKLINKRL